MSYAAGVMTVIFKTVLWLVTTDLDQRKGEQLKCALWKRWDHVGRMQPPSYLGVVYFSLLLPEASNIN